MTETSTQAWPHPRAVISHHDWGIIVLCARGHQIEGMIYGPHVGGTFAGSRFAAEVGAHHMSPGDRFDRLAAQCSGHGCVPMRPPIAGGSGEEPTILSTQRALDAHVATCADGCTVAANTIGEDLDGPAVLLGCERGKMLASAWRDARVAGDRTRKRGFVVDGSRYVFDFEICAPAKGWAQLDTTQDAEYYGLWAQPWTLEIIEYAEGDITRDKYKHPQSFRAAIRAHAARDCWKAIDADREARDQWRGLGLGDLLWPEPAPATA